MARDVDTETDTKMQSNGCSKVLHFDCIHLRRDGETDSQLPCKQAYGYFYDLLPQLIWITDSLGNVIFLNAAWKEYTGSDLCEQWLDFMHPDERQMILKLRETCFTTGSELRQEWRLRNRRGEYRHFMACAKPMWLNGKITSWYGTFTDINDVHTALNHSRQKTSFLANISHDLRTPLTGIIAIADQLLAQDDIAEPISNDISTILNCSLTQLALIDNIMDTCKIEAGKVRLDNSPFSFMAAASHVLKVARLAAKRPKVELKLVVLSDVPESMYGDKQRCMQILTNLLSNAIKFTPNGGVVTVTLRCKKNVLDPQYCTITCDVADTGIGMSGEVLGKVFEAFTQADCTTQRRFGGSGLGLSICKSLIRLMHGTMNVVSQENVGSTFTFTIPFQTVSTANLADAFAEERQQSCNEHCCEDSSSQSLTDSHLSTLAALSERLAGAEIKDDDEEAGLNDTVTVNDSSCAATLSGAASSASSTGDGDSDSSRQRHTILVVEDNDINRRVLCKFLKKAGYAIMMASDGQAAVQVVQNTFTPDNKDATQRPVIDLILMDCHMPILDGYEATKAIRRLGLNAERLPILAVTASATKADHDFCKESGMDDIVYKPYRFKDLLERVEQFLAQRSISDTILP